MRHKKDKKLLVYCVTKSSFGCWLMQAWLHPRVPSHPVWSQVCSVFADAEKLCSRGTTLIKALNVQVPQQVHTWASLAVLPLKGMWIMTRKLFVMLPKGERWDTFPRKLKPFILPKQSRNKKIRPTRKIAVCCYLHGLFLKDGLWRRRSSNCFFNSFLQFLKNQ